MAENPVWENNKEQARVGVIMGSDSDLPVMIGAIDVLTELQVDHEYHFVSAHRTADWMREYAKGADKRGVKVIIAGAGGAAHLPGMTEAFGDVLPVIGVPIVSQGRAALTDSSFFSVVDMPSGKPVSTMAPNGARNAGIEAAKMLAISDDALKELIREMSVNMAMEVMDKDARLQDLGPHEYLRQMKAKENPRT